MVRGVVQAVVVAALIASACSGGSDAAVPETDATGTDGTANVEPDAETAEDDETDGEESPSSDEDDGDANQQVDGMDDAMLALALSELDDDDIGELLLDLDEDGVERVLRLLDEAELDEAELDGAELDEGEEAEPTPAPAVDPASELDDETQATLTELQENGFCDPADVDDDGVVTAMHFVVGGQVQPPCWGEVDPRLDAAWAVMAEVTPTELLDDVSLFAGFEGCDSCDTDAFVKTLDDAGEFFVMAVDVQTGAEDPDEQALTMLHEMAHVLNQDPTTQLNTSIGADACTTYFNGNGCLRDGAYSWEWIQQFWDTEALATVTGDDVNDEAGEARCTIDAPYTGSYGASDPEEDFAQVFSAYVFNVEVKPALDPKLAFFNSYPEFQEIRDAAESAGLHGADYGFEQC